MGGLTPRHARGGRFSCVALPAGSGESDRVAGSDIVIGSAGMERNAHTTKKDGN